MVILYKAHSLTAFVVTLRCHAQIVVSNDVDEDVDTVERVNHHLLFIIHQRGMKYEQAAAQYSEGEDEEEANGRKFDELVQF